MLLTTANGQARERDREVGREGKERERATHKQSSPTTAGPLSIHCVPHHMPIHGASGGWEAGERHSPTQSRRLCCGEEERGGRGRVRQRGREQCEKCNYELSAWKVQVLSKVGINSLQSFFFMINPSVMNRKHRHSLLSFTWHSPSNTKHDVFHLLHWHSTVTREITGWKTWEGRRITLNACERCCWATVFPPLVSAPKSNCGVRSGTLILTLFSFLQAGLSYSVAGVSARFIEVKHVCDIHCVDEVQMMVDSLFECK